MPEQLVGTVVHYFKGPSVAVVRLTEGALAVGDRIRFHGHTTDFTEQIVSMEVNHQKVAAASVGDEGAIQGSDRTRQHDQGFHGTPCTTGRSILPFASSWSTSALSRRA